jgi:hypothetical protein
MARPNLISQYMNAGLPIISHQKKLLFRPSLYEVDSLYRAINRSVFDNQLTQPEIYVGTIRKAWGLCTWLTERQKRSSWGKQGTWCSIQLMDKWISPQWFCVTLAHEMVHQYQWDVYRWEHRETFGRDISIESDAHGPSFYAWRPRFEENGMPLKRWHGQRRWYKSQNLFKA